MIITTIKIIVLLVGIAGVICYFRSIARVILLNSPQPDLIERMIRRFVLTIFHRLARNRPNYEAVQKIQAWVMPIYLISMVISWFLLVQFSFTFILWGLHAEPSWDTAFSASGSALTTLGYFTPSSFLGKFFSVYEAAIGLAIVMLIFTFVPGYQSAIQLRERKVGWLYARTGRNPNVNTLIEALLKSEQIDKDEMWYEWENWFRGIHETHSLSPILAYVPSIYEGSNWVKVTKTVLDTASLILSCLDKEQTDSVRLTRQTGVDAVALIAAKMKNVDRDRSQASVSSLPLEADEFDNLYQKLAATHLAVEPDKEKARAAFYAYFNEYSDSITRIFNSTLTGKR